MASIEQIWYENPLGILFNVNDLIKFIPDFKMTFIEQMNASVRFALYFSIIMFVIKRDTKMFYIFIFVCIFTALLYVNFKHTNSQQKELFDKLNLGQDKKNRTCFQPTLNNPFMNVSYGDYKDFPNRPSACIATKTDVKKKIDGFFDQGLYRDVDDIFHKNASDRQFYTNPSTNIPNNAVDLANWLYKTSPTCKEKNLACG